MENINFTEIKNKTKGMLSGKVYEKIYYLAYNPLTPNLGNLVEVGTAHGAATISLALGLKHSCKNAKVYTFEKILGGSRERYGGIDENIQTIQSNFQNFEVENWIKLIIGNVETEYERLKAEDKEFNQPISLLMLDADGAIDRDFSYFYNQLVPEAPIIIDDYRDVVAVRYDEGACIQGSSISIALKHKLTYELVNFFIEQGLLEKELVIAGTFFGRKPKSINHSIKFKELDILRIYRKIMNVEATLPRVKNNLIKSFVYRKPKLHDLIKKIRGNE